MRAAEVEEIRSVLARLEKLQRLVREDIKNLDRLKGEVLATIERFEQSLGITAPALWVKELRDAIEAIFEDTEQGNDDTGT